MATFVIVHGAFGGGWEWTAVAQFLRPLGHNVFTPTLTGFGERIHVGSGIDLSINIEDVVSVLEFEDLQSVVLCGASYGGMAVTGAAERVSHRVAAVVYIDALVPRHGQSGLDLLPDAFAELVKSVSDGSGDGWVPVPQAVLPPEGLIPEATRAQYIARLRPQPVLTFTESLQLSGAAERLRRAFIRCTNSRPMMGSDPIAPFAALARESGWHYREIAAPHDPQLFDPRSTAAVLHEVAIALAT